MFKLRKEITRETLKEIGFIEKNIIIHPSRTYKEDELWIGQIDEDGNRQKLYVFRTPKVGRFDVDIVVNYRDEIYGSMSGFTSGGLELERALDDKNSRIYFRAEDRYPLIQDILNKIAVLCD